MVIPALLDRPSACQCQLNIPQKCQLKIPHPVD
jgi:hypothetical protein